MLTCNFDPVIFELLGFGVRWYGLMYFLSFLFGIRLVIWQSALRGQKISREKLVDFFFWVFVAMLIFARLGHFVFYNFSGIENFFAVWRGGMSFHGGFIGVVLACIFLAKRYKLKLLEVGDLLIVPAMLALSLGRIGNLINCEIFGRVTDLPWGVVFPNVDNLPRHPAQVYEAVFYFFIFLLLYFFALKRPKSGVIFFWGMTLVSFVRILNEFFRVPDYFAWEWVTIGQVLSLPLFLVGIGGLYFLRKK